MTLTSTPEFKRLLPIDYSHGFIQRYSGKFNQKAIAVDYNRPLQSSM
jgi:hypothetical protein